MTSQPLNIIPGPQYTGTDQYVIVDPTAPNHIHLRGGGPIDSSSALLYLGGENNNFMVSDGAGSANINAQNAVFVAPVPVAHGDWASGFVVYKNFNVDYIAPAATAGITLDEIFLGAFKCIIHARDVTTGDTESFEYLITNSGTGDVAGIAYPGVDSGAGALVTALATHTLTGINFSLTNVAASANYVSVRIHTIALPQPSLTPE